MSANRLLRNTLGVVLSVGMLYFLSYNDLQGWLIPYLLLTGLISAIVAGSPLGWAIAATVFVVWGAVDLVRTILIFGPSQDWNLVAVFQTHSIERLIVTFHFAVVSILGGLLGWGLSRAGSEIYHKCSG